MIAQAAKLINSAKQIVILTGAGVSKESGIPTFREAQTGLWETYDAQQLATPQAFRNNPKLVWEWYEFRRHMIGEKRPNPGHVALAELEKRFPSTWIITQNIDDLHEQAGSEQVIHLHGNIAQHKCFDNCQGNPTIIDTTSFEWDKDDGPPPCPHCGAWVRPNVVWFTEMLPEKELNQAFQLSLTCDLMIVIGTSGLVTPAAALPGKAKNRNQAKIIEINPNYSMITSIADIKLEGPSGEIMPQIMKELE